MSRSRPPVLKIVAEGQGYRATSDECPGLSVYAPTYGMAEAEGNAMVNGWRANPHAFNPTLVTRPGAIPPGALPAHWMDNVPPPPPPEPMTLAEAPAQYAGTPEGADVPEHPDDIPADRPRRGRPPKAPA